MSLKQAKITFALLSICFLCNEMNFKLQMYVEMSPNATLHATNDAIYPANNTLSIVPTPCCSPFGIRRF